MASEKQDSVGGSQGGGGGPMKFSRYRSVRKAAKQPPVSRAPSAAGSGAHAPNPQDDFATALASNTTIKRSMSRYRRPRTSTSQSTPDPPPFIPTPTDRTQDLAHQGRPRGDTVDSPVRRRSAGRSDGVGSRLAADNKTDSRSATEERPYRGGDHNRAHANNGDHYATARDLHRQNAMDSLTGGDKNSSASASAFQRPTVRLRTRKNTESENEPDDNRTHDWARSRPSSQEIKAGRRRSKNQQPTPPSGKPPNALPNYQSDGDATFDSPVESGALSRFPGVDAPVSAVNSGERAVHVQFKKHTFILNVVPSTSAQDLLLSAAEVLDGQIDPHKYILVESFRELGLERSLRRYEYIRDVMNSWASDGENRLIIVPPASLDALSMLDPQSVSSEPPADVTVQMYYSQRPRKWDKRYVTLRSDGQITVSKKERSQDQTNTCHLSDFDMYSLTSSYYADSVRPPKKVCQAVKSQQKSSMFLSTEKFVHFFSTNHKDIAETWYKAVQAWRSWYLVTKLCAGKPEERRQSQIDADDARSGVKSPPKPLMNPFESSDEGMTSSSSQDPSKTTTSKQLFSRKKSSRGHGPPPCSLPKSLATEADSPLSQLSEAGPFTSSGLLGRTYTVRQRAMKEREEQERRANEEAFTQGLVGTMTSRPSHRSTSQPNSRSNTMTSAHAPDHASLMKRSQSVKSKPLVDLTPVYQEPPQHARKGRAVTVDPGMPLIDAATSRDGPLNAITIPPATTWKRPNIPPVPELPTATTADRRTRKRSNTARSVSNHPRHHQTYTAPSSPTSPVDGAQYPQREPFIPNSLLARTAQLAVTASGAPIGHGVATGDRNAAKPMLDMTPQSPFAEGSLLRNL